MRQRRYSFFQSLMARVPPGARILDIGGTTEYWRLMQAGSATPSWTVVVLNREVHGGSNCAWVTSICGDALALPFADHTFDVAFSNSVIEHVGGFVQQTRMAQEIRRVSRRYFVQTPNRSFPLEPHFLMPGFQWWPMSLRAWLLTRRSLGWFERAESYGAARAAVESITLLSRRDLQALFPDAQLYRERVLGLTKSLIVYAGW